MTQSTSPKPPASPGLRMLIDFGPLIVLFLVTQFMPGPALARLLAATVAFMIAMFIAIALSWWKTRHISPMLWISGGFVLIFGGLTLWLHDGTFIKVKPTIVYALFAVVLGYGLIARKPLLQNLLGTAYPGLSERGWRLLTMNWAVFFVFMAVLNEIVWRWTAPGPQDDLSFWAGFKLWGAIPLTLLFAMGNIPLLLRHGLQTDGEIVDKALPPEG